jgi:hypothetical protein
MGLDMYACFHKQNDDETTEIAYWRKHNALHNWMQQHSGIDADKFNCIRFYLTKELLEELKEDILNCNLECTSGFFFGNTEYMQEYKEIYQGGDLNFVNEALELIKDKDNLIYYTSWW